jgi:2-methylcitrate dehydratase PrpD
MATHFHDYDDDDPALSVGHPSAPVFAALCALADWSGASTERIVAAYIAGVETTMRVGRIMNPDHYNAGWHATATLGVFGATVASGLLLALDDDQVEAALDIAASLASGLKCNFGSDVKPLQAGAAAGNAVWAVQLAARDVTSAEGALFGPTGFCRVYAGHGAAEEAIETYGQPFGLASPGLNIKRYPCCSSTRTALDGLLELMQQHEVGADDVEAIEAWIGPDVPAILIYDIPSTALEGKFSLRYCLAAAAVRRQLDLSAFAPGAIAAPDVVAMMGRVSVHVDTGLPTIPTGVTHCSRVRLRSRKGDFSIEVHDPLGSTARPLPAVMLRDKFVQCASGRLGRARAEHAFERWEALGPQAPFVQWLELLSPA